MNLKNSVVEPLLEAKTEWVENEYGKHLEWTCPDCGNKERTVRRYATIRCKPCDKIMQSANYNIDSQNPDPQNPEQFLRARAKRRGLPYDYYFPDEDEPTADDPLDF